MAAAVYHLDGRRVRVLGERRAVSAGSYAIDWDGRDEGGALVPPGLYCVRLHIRTNTVGAQVENKTVLRTVAVTLLTGPCLSPIKPRRAIEPSTKKRAYQLTPHRQ